MDYAYNYRDPSRLYLNVTNRCSNRCAFCVRNRVAGIGGAHLRGGPEPDLPDLLAAIAARGGASAFREIVWCGFGEPTLRCDLICELSPRLRQAGARVRLNTNGHGCLIAGRDIMPDLGRVVDAVSVSMNAPDCQRYIELCQPDVSLIAGAGLAEEHRFWEAMCDFLRRAPHYFAAAQATVVGFVLSDREIESCRSQAAALGVTSFRVRG